MIEHVRLLTDGELRGSALCEQAASFRNVIRNQGHLAEVAQTLDGSIFIISSQPFTAKAVLTSTDQKRDTANPDGADHKG